MKSFFNYAKNRILYNLFRIMFVLGIAFLFSKCDVYAMTGSYTNATYSYRDCSNPLECSTSFVSPYTQLGTNVYPTSERIRGVSMRAYNTDGVWKKGDNYNFKWRVCEQSKWGNNESITYLRNGFNFNEFTYNTNDVATGATTGDVADVTYTISDDSSSQYCWFVNFNLTPKDDLQYVGFKASFDVTNEDGGIGLYTGTWFTVGRLDINFTEGVGSIIEENSQEIIKGQEETNDKLDNLNDSINSESENFEEKSCGIICKLGKLPGKIIDGIVNGLKSLFIPKDGYFTSWVDELKAFLEEKLGFLLTPFEIVIDFINKFLDLENIDIIINIPKITVPNFENVVLIKEQSFNWSEVLNSKESFKTLWTLYLDFVDVFLIFNFLNLCMNVYNRMIGNNDVVYDYYTVEDSYSYDTNTGEVLSARRNERKTTRKRSDKK